MKHLFKKRFQLTLLTAFFSCPSFFSGLFSLSLARWPSLVSSSDLGSRPRIGSLNFCCSWGLLWLVGCKIVFGSHALFLKGRGV